MAAIERRRLGRTDMIIPALSLGCAWIGSEADSDEQARAAVHRALEHGIDYFDTAPSYMKGKGEERLAAAIRGLDRGSYLLSTKFGNRPGIADGYSAQGARRSVEMSLQTLGCEYLDLLLIHDPDDISRPLAPGAALDEMLRMREQGLVRYLGLGTRPHIQHRAAIETGQIDVIISFKDYTLLNQSAALDSVPLALQRGVGVLLGSPLDMGQLAGPEPDRAKSPRAHAMWRWCRGRGLNLRDLALQFCLALPIDGGVLVGAATADQVDQAVTSATRPIGSETWRDFAREFGVSPGATAEPLPEAALARRKVGCQRQDKE